MISNQQAVKRAFRTDINGLRAWAVVAVIFFHFGLSGFAGGFVGVDVFFVISGFLMTQIIVGGLENQVAGGGFSLLEFYLARARRIVPALLVLCAVLLLIGWFFLPSPDYGLLGRQLIWSIGFFSNVKFFGEAGYFDVASHEKWLLHTWSLSVEWQFYLVLPLMLIAVWKLRPGRAFTAAFVGVAFFASLATSVVLASREPGAAFYLLPSRAWEMLAGGLVYLLSHRIVLSGKGHKAVELIGLGLIALSVALFSAKTAWPGSWALVPVMGAVLVLLAARPASIWTGSRVAQWLGTRSYSLYLWHWPIVAALFYLELQHHPLALTLGLILTLGLGHLSYAWVETPARRRMSKLRLRQAFAAIALASLVVGAPATAVRVAKGFPGRLSESVEVAAREAHNNNPRRDSCHVREGATSPSCLYGGERLRAVLIGDSHADTVANAVAAALPGTRDAVMQWSHSGCPTLIGATSRRGGDSEDLQCEAFNAWVLEHLDDVLGEVPLIVVNRTGLYAKDVDQFAADLVESACELAKAHPVYLVRPVPEMHVNVPREMSRRIAFGLDGGEVFIPLDEYRARHAVVWAAQNEASTRCGVKILDPLPYLCREGRCYGSQDGRPLYYDSNHLSEYGNRRLVPMFAEVFARH